MRGWQQGEEAAAERGRQPVWEDEEDEALEVNITGQDRLRKLRQSEEEAVLSGVPACLAP
jgi:hypothetical protein